jgi:hypothetical protein
MLLKRNRVFVRQRSNLPFAKIMRTRTTLSDGGFYINKSFASASYTSIWCPFSISNPADRVFFIERTFHVPCEGASPGWAVPRVETLYLFSVMSLSPSSSSSSFVLRPRRLGIEAVCQDGRRIHGESKRRDFRSYHPKYGRGRRTRTRTIADDNDRYDSAPRHDAKQIRNRGLNPVALRGNKSPQILLMLAPFASYPTPPRPFFGWYKRNSYRLLSRFILLPSWQTASIPNRGRRLWLDHQGQRGSHSILPVSRS